MGADINARVYEDTKRFCEQSSSLKKRVEASIAAQKIIRETDILDVPDKNRYAEKA